LEKKNGLVFPFPSSHFKKWDHVIWNGGRRAGDSTSDAG